MNATQGAFMPRARAGSRRVLWPWLTTVAD